MTQSFTHKHAHVDENGMLNRTLLCSPHMLCGDLVREIELPWDAIYFYAININVLCTLHIYIFVINKCHFTSCTKLQ